MREVNKIFFFFLFCLLLLKEMSCLLDFHNKFYALGYYWWGRKVILVVGSN